LIKILGFEGTSRDCLITYGAAAVAVDTDRVRNAVTGRVSKIEEGTLDAVTLLPGLYEVDDRYAETPMIVVAICWSGGWSSNGGAFDFDDWLRPLSPYYHPTRARYVGVFNPIYPSPYGFYVFPVPEFKLYCSAVALRIAQELVQRPRTQYSMDLVNAGLVLSVRDPMLNLLRIEMLESDSQKIVARRMAAALTGAENLARAEKLLQLYKDDYDWTRGKMGMSMDEELEELREDALKDFFL
jgi:hypothetical protein